jgi:hypothetical protein
MFRGLKDMRNHAPPLGLLVAATRILELRADPGEGRVHSKRCLQEFPCIHPAFPILPSSCLLSDDASIERYKHIEDPSVIWGEAMLVPGPSPHRF